jgi:hypothetical protein
MFRSDGVQLCAVLFAPHRSAPSDHPLRRAIEAVDEEVTADHGALVTRRLGTGVLACFPSASAAFAAAVALQQRATLQHAEHPPAIGISCGEILLSDDDNMGMTTVIAARLAAAAAPGEILGSDIACVFAGQHTDLVFVEHSLKGVPGTVAAALLPWPPAPTVAAALGLPPALQPGDEPFAGRHDELAAVRARLEQLGGGAGDVVLLTGEPGAGKSALLARIADEAAALQLPVLYGRCDESVPRPYAPIAEMLRRVLHRDPRGSVALGGLAGELSRLVPEVRTRYPQIPAPLSSDADTERARLLEAFGAWLRQCGKVGMVLVVDDVHWADPGTITVLAEACALARSHGVLIIAAARTATDAAQDLFVDLRLAGALDLRLRGLAAEEIAALLPAGADPALADQVHRRSNGNPFFVRELLRTADDPADAAYATESIRQVVLRRIAGLSEATRKLLAAASVMGLSFDAMLLVDVGAADANTFLDLLDEAVAAGVVVERVEGLQIAHEFVHALTSDALYEEMSTLRRARLHQQLAVALELRGAATEVLAHHFRAAAAVGEAARALQYTLLAADGALATFANEQALHGYRQAATLLAAMPSSTPEQQIDVDIRIGECLRRLGLPEYLPVLFSAAAAASERADGERMAAALMASYRGSFHQAFVVNQDLIALLERALQLLGADAPRTRALLLARLAVELAWSEHLDRARKLSDEAMRLAEQLDDEVVLARVLVLRQWTLFESLAERLEWQQRTDAIVRRHNDPALLLEALDMAYFNAERAGDGPTAERLFVESKAIAEQLDSAMAWWNFTRLATTRGARVGDEHARMAGIGRAHQVGKAAKQPDAGLRRSGELFWVEFDHAQPDAQRETMATTWRFGFVTPFGTGSSIAHRCLDLGMFTEAGEIYAALRPLVAEPLQHQVWLTVQSQLTHLAVGLGDVEDALILAQVLAPHRDLVANMWFSGVGSVARYLGEVRLLDGDQQGAIAEFEHACEVNRRAGAVGWLARTSLDLAGALRRRGEPGDSARAEALVAEAAVIARDHNYPLIAERAALMAAGANER